MFFSVSKQVLRKEIKMKKITEQTNLKVDIGRINNLVGKHLYVCVNEDISDWPMYLVHCDNLPNGIIIPECNKPYIGLRSDGAFFFRGLQVCECPDFAATFRYYEGCLYKIINNSQNGPYTVDKFSDNTNILSYRFRIFDKDNKVLTEIEIKLNGEVFYNGVLVDKQINLAQNLWDYGELDADTILKTYKPGDSIISVSHEIKDYRI
jgi:hypothetical protein